jgi:uncharacterized membrane protein (DUF485 family)
VGHVLTARRRGAAEAEVELPPRFMAPRLKTVREQLDSAEFRHLVGRRWRISLLLTALLFVVYYGYIILIAVDRGFLSRRIGTVTTLGIPIGAAVIVAAWVLTAAYVVWANRQYDGEVARLRNQMETR